VRFNNSQALYRTIRPTNQLAERRQASFGLVNSHAGQFAD